MIPMRTLTLDELYHNGESVVRLVGVYRRMAYIERYGGRRDYVPLNYFMQNYSEVYK